MMNELCLRQVGCGWGSRRGGHLDKNSPDGPFSGVRGPQQRGKELYY